MGVTGTQARLRVGHMTCVCVTPGRAQSGQRGGDTVGLQPQPGCLHRPPPAPRTVAMLSCSLSLGRAVRLPLRTPPPSRRASLQLKTQVGLVPFILKCG